MYKLFLVWRKESEIGLSKVFDAASVVSVKWNVTG